MTETRYIVTYDQQGNILSQEPYLVSDMQLNREQLEQYKAQALAAYANWSALTAAQKDLVLHRLLFAICVYQGWL